VENNTGFPAPAKRKIFSGGIKVLLFRMWVAGAVCFFAAWGKTGSEEAGNAYSVDLIAGLILFLVLSDWIIVDPVLRMIMNKKKVPVAIKDGKAVWDVFLTGFLRVMRITASVLLIVGTYFLLNTILIRLFGLDEKSVPVPLEPLLFGILYGLYFTFFDVPKKIITRSLNNGHEKQIHR
jgi:hypothetical protein